MIKMMDKVSRLIRLVIIQKDLNIKGKYTLLFTNFTNYKKLYEWSRITTTCFLTRNDEIAPTIIV